MNIGDRLEAIGKLVLVGCVLADIGTDHAYLPVWLLEQGKITSAIAGDIAEGPCLAAKNTVSMHGMKGKVEVRLGSGLKVLQADEAECIAIAGMGASTMIEILMADMSLAVVAKRLVLQPMAGAASLRKWLCQNGWCIVAEDLVADGRHLYEIIAAERGESPSFSEAEYEIGPKLIADKHPLLTRQFARQIGSYKKLLSNMGKSQQARESTKYLAWEKLVQELEALADACNCK
ncbi:MAG: SAM-dependent methyltransferase [Phascolarctobacterium sp.]|nr:SAM-dependent methyltransferase [Phascolarctobacterium sp.]